MAFDPKTVRKINIASKHLENNLLEIVNDGISKNFLSTMRHVFKCALVTELKIKAVNPFGFRSWNYLTIDLY